MHPRLVEATKYNTWILKSVILWMSLSSIVNGVICKSFRHQLVRRKDWDYWARLLLPGHCNISSKTLQVVATAHMLHIHSPAIRILPLR